MKKNVNVHPNWVPVKSLAEINTTNFRSKYKSGLTDFKSTKSAFKICRNKRVKLMGVHKCKCIGNLGLSIAMGSLT